MNIAEAKQHIKDAVEIYLSKDEMGMANISLPKQRPMFLLGAPGIGKTAIMAQIAEELGVGLVSYSMTHHTRQSALGLPFIVHRDFRGMEYDSSEYTMSEIVASIYDYIEKTGLENGILFLDEINCVSETLYPSMLQFLQYKTFGRHRIPENWVVVCAGNPPEYNKSVHEFDVVTLDRLRRLEVEPDFETWKAYALKKNVHPAVLSFLEVEHACFYSVISSPSGKRFVTARGWDDLSETITMAEKLGKPVDLTLIEQFIQDEEIADKFSVYYQLFNKYRSDYQVDRILAGELDEGVIERARKSAFDERLAVLGLLLDGLAPQLAEALQHNAALEIVRDFLRSAKVELNSGASAEVLLGTRAAELHAEVNRMKESGAASESKIRVTYLAETMLKELLNECRKAGTLEGSAAFDTIHYAYRGYVGALEQAIKKGSVGLDSAFEFVERAFKTDREMLVFVTELTACDSTVRFIDKFGNDRYYANNTSLMVNERRESLANRMKDLMAAKKDAAEDEAPAMEEPAKETPAVAVSAGALDIDVDNELQSYYQANQFEYGFASLCNMTLPAEMTGMNVLNIGCRRGKGCFKMSEFVGEGGKVVGIDWSADYINEAKSRAPRAAVKSGLSKNNMEFHLAYPEDLSMANVEDNSMDLVFVNSVINLACHPEQVMREIYRVLKPGGTLMADLVVASGPRDETVIAKAKELGNSIQAAPSKAKLEALFERLGFQAPVYVEEHEVDPAQGFKTTHAVEVAPSNEKITFTACAVELRK